jgi:hypothetical protein
MTVLQSSKSSGAGSPASFNIFFHFFCSVQWRISHRFVLWRLQRVELIDYSSIFRRQVPSMRRYRLY